MRSPRAGGMQSEPAQETEAVEHLAAFRQSGNKFVIHLLVQIKAGFVPREQVGFKSQPIQLHDNRPAKGAREHAIGFGQSFKLPRSHVAALEDRPRRKQILKRGQNPSFPLLHP